MGARGARKWERFSSKLDALRARLRERLPDIDPDDLDLILASMLKPPSEGRYFIYPEKGGGYSF